MKKTILLSLFLVSLSITSQTLFTGLQACYPLDLSAANAATTGASFNGTLSNVTPTVGHTNQANTSYQLNGTTSSYIELPDNPGLKSNSVFFSGWFYINQLPNEQYLVFTKNSCFANFEAYSLITYNNQAIGQQVFRLSKSNNNCMYAPQVESTTAPVIGNWYHLAFFIDNAFMKLYVNGVLEASATHTIMFDYVSGKSVFLGVTNENNFNLPFSGRIDDVRFYNRELTAAEVSTLYNTTPGCVQTSGSAPTTSFTASKNRFVKAKKLCSATSQATTPAPGVGKCRAEVLRFLLFRTQR